MAALAAAGRVVGRPGSHHDDACRLHPQLPGPARCCRSTCQPPGGAAVAAACGNQRPLAMLMLACQPQLAPRGSLVTSRAKPARKDGPQTAPPSQQQRKPALPQGPDGQQQQQGGGDDDGEDDGFLDLDEFEGGEGEDGEDFGEGSEEAVEEFDAEGLGLEPDDAERVLQTGNEAWGEVALRAAQEVLSKPGMAGLELFLFKALPGMKKIDVRLDKLDDMYGSPSIDDIERFSRALSAELEAALGLEAAGEIMFEVSSPGAERELKLPEELDRFSELPLKVEYVDAKGAASSGVLQLVSYDTDAGVTVWRLADVKANAPVKGRGMSKKQQQQRFTIPVADIKKARVFVDFGLLLQ